MCFRGGRFFPDLFTLFLNDFDKKFLKVTLHGSTSFLSASWTWHVRPLAWYGWKMQNTTEQNPTATPWKDRERKGDIILFSSSFVLTQLLSMSSWLSEAPKPTITLGTLWIWYDYKCMYVCMYVCIYIYIHTYICIYNIYIIYIYICEHVYIYIYM